MRPASSPKLIVGGFTLPAFSKDGTLDQIFTIMDKHQVRDIDTAYIYPDSEDVLGKHDAPTRYVMHTKARGFQPGALAKQSVLDSMSESLARLGVNHVETYFLHCPDRDTPISETLSAISQLYKEGKFKHFGLSNFKPEQVQEIYSIQEKNGEVLPTVFQGNYNAVSRHIEADLFPLLRKLNIAFYAYSPIAGGFLVKTSKGLKENSHEGRWQKGGETNRIAEMYHNLYKGDAMYAALDEWESIAKEEGISKAALAFRWVTFNSALTEKDGVIMGATKAAQLEETLEAIEQGPLSKRAADRIDAIWKSVEAEAPRDNYHG